ncbi:MAG: glycoside hydrolase family 5 protein [Colwellia sp.]
MSQTIFLYIKIIIFLCVISSSYEATAKEKQNFITVKGSQIIDQDGNAILLRGTNLGNWLLPEGYMFKFEKVNSPHRINLLINEMIGPEDSLLFWQNFMLNYVTQEDINYLKEIGLNHIRLPFNYRMLTDDDYLGVNNHGFNYIDKTILWAKNAGLSVLLDMHAAPCGQTGDNIDDSFGYPYLLTSKTCQEKFIDIWKKIAQRYKDEPTVLGYDFLNEPVAHYFSKDQDKLEKTLVDLYKRTTKAVRKIDNNHLIFLGGSIWNTNFSIFSKPFDDKLVYEFHKYWMDVDQKEIQQYVDYSNKYQVPIYVGETGENTDEWVKDFRILLEKNNIHWAYWPYKKMENSRGIMNFNKPKNYDLIIKYAESDRSSYENIRANLPDRVKAKEALNSFIENSKFKNSFQNKGYIKSLGFHPTHKN